MTGNTSGRGAVHFFTHHRVAANLLMTLMILSGLWALTKLNTQFFPNFALDMATVRVVWSGASAADVEQSITTPLEQELRSVNGLKEITSTSATGVASITLEFAEGTDIGDAVDEVRERVARVRNFPSTAEEPEITQVVRYEPIARLIITGAARLDELREMSYRIKDELLDRGIAKVDITGLPEQEITVEVSSLRLQELGLTLPEIADRIRKLSQDIPAGAAGRDDVGLQLRALAQQRSAAGFAALPIVTTESGTRITVGDIATVTRRAKEGGVTLLLEGKPAVELLLQRTETSDALDAARILDEWLQDTRAVLPPNLHMRTYDESWRLIDERITVLLANGLGGLALVIAILFLFLHGRVAFWVTVGIPTSFLATLALVYLFGGSINMLSLFGLIMALGVIVDDAIVVAENAVANHERGEDPESAAEHGAQRMFYPVLSSSLTTIAAFLPLMLVGGIIGKMMFEIPFVVVCVVAASFLECLLVLPAHMRSTFLHIGRREPARFRQRLDAAFDRFRDQRFRPVVEAAVRNRFTTVVVAVCLFSIALALPLSGRVGFTFFPGVESTIIYANASFTAGSPSERVAQFLDELNVALRAAEEAVGEEMVVTAVERVGTSSSGDASGQRRGEQYGSLIVELTSPDARETRNLQFIREWQERITLPPGIELFTINQRVGGPPGQDLDIRLKGRDATALKQAALELQEKLRSYAGVSGVEDDLPWGQEQLIYHLTATGRALGLTTENMGRQLRAAFDGDLVQVFQTADEEIEVRVRLPDAERNNLAVLNRLQLVAPGGKSVPLQTLVTLEPRKDFEARRHTDGRLAVRVSADVDRSLNNSNRILADLDRTFLPALANRHRIQYSFEGRAADQAETMTDMRNGALLAVALIYIILVWIFASYSRPLVIMTAIPFGFIGAVTGHYVMGIDLTVLSMFGIVGLSGIVVNDSIILIAFYRELREAGVPVAQAIVEAACARLRAVLLTSLTTIGGLSPLLFEGSVQAQFLIPMATSITFGIAFSTVLVLLVIPAILSIVESAVGSIKARASGPPLRVNPSA